MITRTDRPSPSVEDAAIRLIRRGWLGRVHPVPDAEPGEVQFTVPSASRSGARYTVTAETRSTVIRCTCPAGRNAVHCKHIVLVQLLRGWIADKDPSPTPPPADLESRLAGLEKILITTTARLHARVSDLEDSRDVLHQQLITVSRAVRPGADPR